MRIDEQEEAETLFTTGIDSATTSIDKGIANRSYAQFLTDENRQETADTYFERAIDAFSGPGDRLIYYRSTTYERWSRSLHSRDRTAAKLKLRLAIGEWRKHNNVERAMAEAGRLIKSYQDRFPEDAVAIAIDFKDLQKSTTDVAPE